MMDSSARGFPEFNLGSSLHDTESNRTWIFVREKCDECTKTYRTWTQQGGNTLRILTCPECLDHKAVMAYAYLLKHIGLTKLSAELILIEVKCLLRKAGE